MALERDYTDEDTEVAVTRAYYRIEHLAVDVRARTGTVTVAVYKSAAVANRARPSGERIGRPLRTLTLHVPQAAAELIFALPEPNETGNPTPVIPLRKSYAYLKTLPEFTASTDA